MAKDKVSKFIDAYADELGLDNEIRGYLKELIPNLAKKYEGTNIDIRQDNLQTYLINPGNEDYNLEDFFMNRLFHNVVQVRSEGSLEKHTKGHYVADSKMIELDNDRINNQIKFSKKSATELEEIKRNARKKVIMHEFEHGIQALFSEGKLSEGSKAICENIRKKLLKIDAGRYAEEISEEYNEQNMHGYEKNVSLGFSEKTMTHVRHNLLLEIFNESECLDMAKVTKPQIVARYKSGNQFDIYNDESSNSSITGYGYMLKALLGKDETFEGMYFNPEKIMNLFEQRYGDIIEEAYSELLKGKSDMSTMDFLEKALKEIKDTNSEEKHLKLNMVLTKCLERNIEITKQFDSKEELSERIAVFKKYLISNNDQDKNNELNHNQIIQQIEENREISKKCSEPEILQQYWKNGIGNEFELQVEEVYWEDVLNNIVDLQIGNEDINKVVMQMSTHLKTKKAIVYDLARKSGRSVDKAYAIPNLKNRINSIDSLTEIVNLNENLILKDLMEINEAIKQFEKGSLDGNDKQKIDFIRDKFNYICEVKKKEAISNISRIYEEKSVVTQSRSGVDQIEQILSFVPPNMRDKIYGKARVMKCDIIVSQGLKSVFQLSEENLILDEENENAKREALHLKSEQIMKLPPSSRSTTHSDVDWDEKWRIDEDDIGDICKTVRKGEFDECTDYLKKVYLEYREPMSVKMPNKEETEYDWD